MELKKGENMAEHQNEIFARPARTWFQTAHEKQKSKGSPKRYSLFSRSLSNRDSHLRSRSTTARESKGTN